MHFFMDFIALFAFTYLLNELTTHKTNTVTIRIICCLFIVIGLRKNIGHPYMCSITH